VGIRSCSCLWPCNIHRRVASCKNKIKNLFVMGGEYLSLGLGWDVLVQLMYSKRGLPKPADTLQVTTSE
jgi:hypothetical protein